MIGTIPEKITLQLSQDELQTILVALHTLDVVTNTKALERFSTEVTAQARRFYAFPQSDQVVDVGLVSDVLYEALYAYWASLDQLPELSDIGGISIDLSDYVEGVRHESRA